MPYKLSQTDPALAKGDVNGDGFDDVYLGGAYGQAGTFLMSDTKGGFSPKTFPDFVKDAHYEDVAATFLDADGDGNLDLYVGSGSYEFDINGENLIGRLYMNDGAGNFTRDMKRLPEIPQAVGVVAAADFDNDGDGDKDIVAGNWGLNSKHKASTDYPFHVYAKDFNSTL